MKLVSKDLKAFDRVWRKDLLIRTIVKGLLIASRLLLLQKRKVQINRDGGQQLPLRQGIPQGSILSPLLFLLYINDRWQVVPENVEVAMFVDDVSRFSSYHNKEDLQEAITPAAE